MKLLNNIKAFVNYRKEQCLSVRDRRNKQYILYNILSTKGIFKSKRSRRGKVTLIPL